MIEELDRIVEQLFCEQPREIFLNLVVLFHGAGPKGTVNQLALHPPLFTVRKQGHTLQWKT